MHRQQTTSVSGRFPCLLGMGPKIMVPENQQQIWKHSTVAFTPACPQFPDVTPDSCSGYCSSSLKKGKDVTGVWFPRPLSWNHPPPAHHQVLSEHLLVCVPSQRPIPPSTVIPTVILRFILCHFSSRTFLSYNQPCSTQTDFSLIQDLSKNLSLAKKKKWNSLYFSFFSNARTEAPGMPDISPRALGYHLADSASGLLAAQMKGFISTWQQRNPKCSC